MEDYLHSKYIIRGAVSLNKLLLVFDYFKEAFHLNKQNKALYAPQIALIAVRVLLIVFAGIGIYNWIGMENINSLSAKETGEILRFFLGQGLKLIGLVLIYSFIYVIIEAGLLNMYKKAISQGYTESGDFKEGVSKYFIKLLAGEIVIAVCYMVALPFYLILGLITLTAGLTLIPFLAGIFLSMWKVSLVMKDNGIFRSIGDSFGFAKRNFWPLSFLQAIHWAFIGGMRGGSGGNFNFSNNAGNIAGNPAYGGVDTQQFLEQFIRIFKIVIAVMIPVVAVVTIGASIVVMIFEVFFTLALFIAYNRDFKLEAVLPETLIESEVSDDTTAPEAEEIVSDNGSPAAADNEEVEQ